MNGAFFEQLFHTILVIDEAHIYLSQKNIFLQRIIREGRSKGVAVGSVQMILRRSSRAAKDLQTEIARLEPWQMVSRSGEKMEEFVKFTAEAFYKNSLLSHSLIDK